MSEKLKFVVYWTEQYDCSAEIEASSAAEAQDIAFDRFVNGTNKPEVRDFASTADWSCISN